MKPEKYIKKYALKHKNDDGPYTSILCYSLVYIKRHKTLYFFDVIRHSLEYSDFDIEIINKSSKETLEEQLKDMFIFSKEIDPMYDYQTIELIDKTGYVTPEKDMHNIKLSYIRYEKTDPFEICDIDNNWKGNIKII